MRFLRWLARWRTEGYGGWTPTFPRLADWLEQRAERERARVIEDVRAKIVAGDLQARSFRFHAPDIDS